MRYFPSRRALAACMAAGLAGALNAQSSVEQQVLAARDAVWRAWFANDTAALARLLPAAAAASDGGATTRWSNRQAIVDQSREFARGGGKLDRIDFANTRVTMNGTAAVVTSDYRLLLRNAARVDTSSGHATEVFVRDGTRWVNPYWHLEPGRGAAREIPLPDTLGANFAIGDSATKTGTPADYDALLGFWEFRFQTRNEDGAFNPAFPGHWSFEKKPGGMLIEDRWRGDNTQNPMGLGTYTYRTFDPRQKRWEMVGVGSGGGAFEHGTTWSDAGNRYAVQHYGPVIMRIRYLSIAPDHFLWRADRSADGGKTWQLDSWTMEAKRIGR